MKMIKHWWHSKTQHKKQNWYFLALICAIIAGGFVEACGAWALFGALPGVGLVWLEGAR